MNEDEKIRLRERLIAVMLQTRTMSLDEAVKSADKIYRWIIDGPAKPNTE